MVAAPVSERFAAALAELRAMAAHCPDDSEAARLHHSRVRADAATGAPVTAHGQRLLETARPWPEEQCQIGECLCGSSLMFGFVDDAADGSG